MVNDLYGLQSESSQRRINSLSSNSEQLSSNSSIAIEYDRPLTSRSQGSLCVSARYDKREALNGFLCRQSA